VNLLSEKFGFPVQSRARAIARDFDDPVPKTDIFKIITQDILATNTEGCGIIIITTRT
jgi:hypothetical protein